MGRISQQTLIKLSKWKMLLTALSEGEHILKLDRKQSECLRTTIARTNYDRPDKDFIYDCCYRGSQFVVSKTRRECHEESAEQRLQA
jgi:hypothetical protein